MTNSIELVSQKFSALKSAIKKELILNGFSACGSEFLLHTGEGYCVVRFQSDKYNSHSRKLLTLLIGGGSEFLWRAVPIGFDKYEEKYGVVPFGRRLGWSTMEDKWYVVDSESKVEALLSDFRMRMKNEIMPFSRTFISLDSVLADLHSDQPSVPSAALVLKYISAIESEINERANRKTT